MKGKSPHSRRMRRDLRRPEAEEIAGEAFGRIVADPERLSRFLALTGLDPGSIRAAAAEPGFLPSVLEHVAGDEDLLVAIAEEIDQAPETLARASALLSPRDDDAS